MSGRHDLNVTRIIVKSDRNVTYRENKGTNDNKKLIKKSSKAVQPVEFRLLLAQIRTFCSAVMFAHSILLHDLPLRQISLYGPNRYNGPAFMV